MSMDMNEISRKNFLKLVAAAGATSALAACGSKRAGDSSAATSGDATYADTITFSQGSEPRGLDPAFVDDGESGKVMVQIYENILQYDTETCDVVEGLCELPEVSDDGLTYTFKVKDGIKFHDGTDCDAEAIAKNIQRQLEPDRTDDMPYASFNFGSVESGTGVESVEATDASTLVFKLRAASTPFLANLAMCMSSPIVAPSAFETAMENPVGTGQYKFVSWTKNSNIVLKRNEDYWNADKAGKTENIIFTFIAEAASRVTALNNGEADIIDGIDEAVVDTVEQGGSKIFTMDGMNINYMAFNTQSEIFKDKAARKAFAKAVNVQELVDSLYNGYASVANSVMPTWMASYDEDVKQTEYDADAAKKELADLGITSVKCITYSNPRPYNGKGGQVLAEAIQGYLKEVGVEITIDTYDWTTYKTKVETEAYDICFYGWNGDNGDPDNFMNLLSDPSTSMNVARFQNDEYNELIAKGLQTPSGSDRDAIYLQCEELVAEEQPWLLISHSKNILGYSPKVSDFHFHPTAVTFLYDAVKEA